MVEIVLGHCGEIETFRNESEHDFLCSATGCSMEFSTTTAVPPLTEQMPSIVLDRFASAPLFFSRFMKPPPSLIVYRQFDWYRKDLDLIINKTRYKTMQMMQHILMQVVIK
jgi:hypothetical protein